MYLHRPTLMAKIESSFREIKDQLLERLQNQTVAVTLDIWTDRVMKAYLGVTAHFVKAEGL